VEEAREEGLLEVVLDSWERNNRILVNLLRAIPEGGMEARAMPGSPTVAEMFSHINHVRLAFVAENVPEMGIVVPDEWTTEADRARLANHLNESAKVVREAVKSRVETGRQMEIHFDHPILFLQHMNWHEGYHHGQIKLALKAIGKPLSNQEIGPLTWRVWMNKTGK
jgi:uncharacterized damage-inducible protein DinB